ncbi:MAG: tRNA (adenosine(37)-N6)-threonylcarbamoyltransferase complex dimerization subunit type 1 TsaB [Spirochaetaceae bacterium]|jgi:tRNA threonylcarbamoyladenosine biosynthesis protein TsaB|nr:tRNA (adenosine(37)-N6)-threonylcarbamoyltransferase complex dimerization subunit type 1 TsaB [Spirochaetaceae bacterium]
MKILAIDTSTSIASVGLTASGRFCVQAEAEKSCAEILFEMIDSILKIARIECKDIDLFACMQGPGSWTGLRISFSAVQGFALALNKPFAAIPTLDCIAFSYSSFHGIVIPALDAKQQRFFCAIYQNGVPLSGYMDASPEIIAKLIQEQRDILLTGAGASALFQKLRELCPQHNIMLDASFHRGRALDIINYIEKNPRVSEKPAEKIQLIYLRKSDAEEKNPNVSTKDL